MKARSLTMDVLATACTMGMCGFGLPVLGIMGLFLLIWNIRLNGGKLHYIQAEPVKMPASGGTNITPATAEKGKVVDDTRLCS